ncbi:hypothetical protein BK660_01815 [Pseudomonas brassicacearum]|uniref:Phage abortive infection protein n=1 Tax=Pseudomonas brassicacearum TaxID=930166 RepID=A0A423IG59_9PSED|nr:hypothetical protein [Pseudomonas brassicacearum]RON24433.1 hypothetical protein BK660_01815 [Pseudomonas brassicacearum]
MLPLVGGRQKMNSKINKVLMLTAFFVVLLVVGVVLFYIKNFTMGLSDKQDVWGQFGDYFGGVLNPLLSFFAFVVLLYTVSIQLAAAQESDKRHEEQIFDTRLFQLLAANIEVGKSLFVRVKVEKPERELDSFKVINYLWYRVRTELGSLELEGVGDREYLDSIAGSYVSVRSRFSASTDSYFDSIIFIISYIYRYGTNDEQKDFALSALRSQINKSGRGLLFYFMLFSEKHRVHLEYLLAAEFFEGVTHDPFHSDRRKLLRLVEPGTQILDIQF